MNDNVNEKSIQNALGFRAVENKKGFPLGKENKIQLRVI